MKLHFALFALKTFWRGISLLDVVSDTKYFESSVTNDEDRLKDPNPNPTIVNRTV
jgi:hypothetical protein